jgi:hypothetical protein
MCLVTLTKGPHLLTSGGFADGSPGRKNGYWASRLVIIVTKLATKARDYFCLFSFL